MRSIPIGKSADIEFQIKEPVRLVILDIPRCVKDEHIPWRAIESIKDGKINATKYEGHRLRMLPPHVLIFSNALPDTNNLSADRWRILEIKEKLQKKNEFRDSVWTNTMRILNEHDLIK